VEVTNIHRFFINSENISDNIVTLTGDNAAHGLVLRLRVGEEIVACYGDECLDYFCRVVSVSKNEIRAEILRREYNFANPAISITLYQALPKGDKMSEIVEKCVEIGVSMVVPMVTARCVARPTDRENSKRARWQKIAESAAAQSGRGAIPNVSGVLPFADALTQAKMHDTAVACLETEDKLGLKGFLSSLPQPVGSIGVFVGPEGGFTDEEAAMLKEHGIATVTLGRRILRTETAGAVAVANILYEMDV